MSNSSLRRGAAGLLERLDLLCCKPDTTLAKANMRNLVLADEAINCRHGELPTLGNFGSGEKATPLIPR